MRRARIGMELNSRFVVETEMGPDGRANFENAVRVQLGFDQCIPLGFSVQVQGARRQCASPRCCCVRAGRVLHAHADPPPRCRRLRDAARRRAAQRREALRAGDRSEPPGARSYQRRLVSLHVTGCAVLT